MDNFIQNIRQYWHILLVIPALIILFIRPALVPASVESSQSSERLKNRLYQSTNTSAYYTQNQTNQFNKILSGGDAIECPRYGMYDHAALYIGNGSVIHLLPHTDDNRKDVIVMESLKSFLTQYEPCRINNLNREAQIHQLLPKKRSEIVACAIDTMDKFNKRLAKKYNKYSLRNFNCQHFVTSCRFGEPFSPLIDLAIGNTKYLPFYLRLFDDYCIGLSS